MTSDAESMRSIKGVELMGRKAANRQGCSGKAPDLQDMIPPQVLTPASSPVLWGKGDVNYA